MLENQYYNFLLENISRIPGINSITIAIDENRKDFFFKSIKELNIFSNVIPQLSIHPYNSEKKIIGPIAKLNELLKSPKEFKIKMNDDFLILGGDNVFCFDISKVVQFYREKNSNINAIQKHFEPIDASRFGVPTLDKSGYIKGINEKSEFLPVRFISTACYCINEESIPYISSYISEGKDDNLGRFTDWLSKKTKINSYIFEDEWFDIGTRRGILNANSALMKLNYVDEKIPIKMENEVHIMSPIFIESSSSIKDSYIGPDVFIGSDCIIRNSKIRNSIIYDKCIIRNCNLSNAVIGENSIIEGNINEAVFGPSTRTIGEN